MEAPHFGIGDYLVCRGTGIGRVVRESEMAAPGGTVQAVDIESPRFTGRTSGDSVVTDLSIFYRLPLTSVGYSRVRGLLELPDFLALVRHMSASNPLRISRRELLNHDFSLDFFEVVEGARQAVVLHDYVFHNVLDGKPSCGEYVDLYRHGLSSVALELSLTSGADPALVSELMEAALFAGHQSRDCISCFSREISLTEPLTYYTWPAQKWVMEVLRDGELHDRPDALDGAPIFLDPAKIPNE